MYLFYGSASKKISPKRSHKIFRVTLKSSTIFCDVEEVLCCKRNCWLEDYLNIWQAIFIDKKKTFLLYVSLSRKLPDDTDQMWLDFFVYSHLCPLLSYDTA